MSDLDEQPLRAQLEAAIARVRQQIEIEQRSSHYIGDNAIVGGAITELQAELVQLEEALADEKRSGG
jgi:hypothetical protein